MTEQHHFQQPREESTAKVQQATMNRGQEAIEQTIDLQRNMARTALSAMKWGDTAQRQGLEITQSMMQGFPGQQFTEAMMESYLQGLEAVMPEMERAMEKGMRAAAQPGMEMGQQLEDAGQQPERTGQQMGHTDQGTIGGMETPDRGSQQTGDRLTGEQTGRQPADQSTRGMGSGQPDRSSQGTGGRSQQYSQTGEWIPREGPYGGESSGEMGQRRLEQRMTGGQPGRRSPSQTEYETQSQTGYDTRPEDGIGTERQSHQEPFERETNQRRYGRETQREQYGGEQQGRRDQQRGRGREFEQTTRRGRTEQPRSERR
ncbi:hypothetical protein [Halosolutus gelatinilyticus]|uniref:hypothetical protein n=1 Tax=Halosolutus gelatinilyticus TaxID=2931975 RepID=UPI001FF250FE|nr:hypothetical protein [Halosolutus gelatinilyticus]